MSKCIAQNPLVLVRVDMEVSRFGAEVIAGVPGPESVESGSSRRGSLVSGVWWLGFTLSVWVYGTGKHLAQKFSLESSSPALPVIR